MKTSQQFKKSILAMMGLVLFSSTHLMAQDLKHSIKFNVGANGGYRVTSDDPYSYYYGEEKPMAGINASFEFQWHFKKRISLGLGLEYNLHRHGSSQPYYTDVDSIGNPIDLGTINMNYVRHNLGIPVKLYVNIINNDKIKLYSYVGLNVKFTMDAILTYEIYDGNNRLTQRQSTTLFNPSYGIMNSPINLEAQTGLGMSYKFTPKFFIDANLNFGIDCFNTYFPGSFNEHQYRYGGNIGAGYNF